MGASLLVDEDFLEGISPQKLSISPLLRRDLSLVLSADTKPAHIFKPCTFLARHMWKQAHPLRPTRTLDGSLDSRSSHRPSRRGTGTASSSSSSGMAATPPRVTSNPTYVCGWPRALQRAVAFMCAVPWLFRRFSCVEPSVVRV